MLFNYRKKKCTRIKNYDFMVCKVLSYFKEKLWEEVKTLQLEDKVKIKNIKNFLI